MSTVSLAQQTDICPLKKMQHTLHSTLSTLSHIDSFSQWTPQADIDNSGTIDYGEFIAATLHLNKIEREDHLFAAFSYFDKDGSGYITQDELQEACEEFGIEDAQLEEMIRDVDQDNVIFSFDSQNFANICKCKVLA